MGWIAVKTEMEFSAAIRADNDAWIDIVAGAFRAIVNGGRPRIRVSAGADIHVEAWESSQPHVEAWGSSQPHVEAWGSSQPHVVAWGSSQPHVEARESSQPHVEAWGSSQPHVVAWESSQPHVVAWESSQPHVEAKAYAQLSIAGAVEVKASVNVSILQRGTKAKVDGGKLTVVDIKTADDWCDYYGVEVIDRVAILFKAVDDDFSTDNARAKSIFYRPGDVPVAPDWDGGVRECDGGLHASPHPKMAKGFNPSATHAVACPVKLEDISVHPDGDYPQKVKFRCCCAPVYEVDWSGKRVMPADESTVAKPKHTNKKADAE